MKVHPPQRNQERAFVQEVFWDHSVSQKALALKLTNPEVLLMTVGIYMPRPGAWGHTLIGTGIGKDSWEGNPARRTVKEMADGSAGGKPRGHTTQWSPSQQWGETREGRWDSQQTHTPAAPGCWSNPTGTQDHYKILKLCPHPWLNTGQINAKVTLLPWLHRLEEAVIPLPTSIRRHSLSSVLTREADRVI